MDREIEVLVLDLLRQHNILTLATTREDGWPQATTVGYVNDGLTLYVGCGADSQKVRNIKRSNKVSLTVDRDEEDWSRIQGLSMGATAEVVSDPAEVAHATELMLAKFPQLKSMPEPEPGSFAFLKITPKVSRSWITGRVSATPSSLKSQASIDDCPEPRQTLARICPCRADLSSASGGQPALIFG